jgi:hypothetical protein
MQFRTLDRGAKREMTRMIDEDEFPDCIILGRHFDPRFNNLRRLAHILSIATEVKQLVGEVSRRSWRGVSRVLITVAECRPVPIEVHLRTVGFAITPRQRARYLDCLRAAARKRVTAQWSIHAYSDKENVQQ